MNQLIAIALGGSVGAVMRFLVANGIYAWLGRSFPHGTLFVNVTGSFLMGFLSVLMIQRFSIALEYRAAILVGFLGAYTTFSTFALETISLFEAGSLLKACLNVFLSALLCLVAVWYGLILGRQMFATDPYPWVGQGLPYVDLGLALIAAFFISCLAEWLHHRLDFTLEVRAVILILILGVVTIASTLWLVFKLSEIRFEFHGLLSLFVINALFGVAAVWLGILMGNWLWQLKLSQ
ncbi:fluoride efflux transporter CrcB [Methylicorpusculum oleiharenae]|uniref:fluoride efflux transporter CrcB n=1 Tax=Methylicorpusculum oleiharenae TaxID=1338687 RepID=UPI00135BE2AA